MLFINNEPLNVTVFPDKTSQVWKLSNSILSKLYPGQTVNIKWSFSHEGELMHLAQLKLLLNVMGYCCSLELTYLPYGRQDKEVSNTSTFALRSFASFINHLNFLEVIIHDPHSEKGLKMFNYAKAKYPMWSVVDTKFKVGTNLVCYPDKGALKKYSKIFDATPHIYGEKIRDQLTGNILSYTIIGDSKDKNVLIIDDICDGGATFVLLAKGLLAAGAKEVNLFVTHGIFSKGVKVLFDAGINRVFTEDGEVSKHAK